MTEYRLGSSSLVHTPGLVAWGQNAYRFPKDRDSVLNVFTGTWDSVPAAAFDQLLSQKVCHEVEGETVVFRAYIPTDPKEISEEEYFEALECMPPARWGRTNGVELFHICELLIDNLAAWYAFYQGRYFQFNAPADALAATLVERVKAAA